MARDRAARTRRQLVQRSIAVAGVGLLAGCGVMPSPGQRRATLRRVGYLDWHAGTIDPTIEAFREGMRDLGYVEGQNLLVEYRDAEGDLDRLPALVAALIDSGVEIIVARNNLSALAVSRATSAIPIVAAGADVVGAGLVTNIARPEGNLTGVTSNSTETLVKWIELLTETVPTISRLAVMVDPSGRATQANLQQVQHAAQALQLQHTFYDLRALDHLSAALSKVRADGADGLVLVSGGVVGGGNDPRIGDAVLKSRLPAVAQQRLFAVAGGLLAHGANTTALVRRSASYVDKILNGARPGDLPVELPTEFDIVVNLQTAHALGITVPQSVLRRATEIIQ